MTAHRVFQHGRSTWKGLGSVVVATSFAQPFLPRRAPKVQEGAALFHLLDNGDGEAENTPEFVTRR